MAGTNLTGFMDLCVHDPFTRTMYYADISRFFFCRNRNVKKKKKKKKKKEKK